MYIRRDRKKTRAGQPVTYLSLAHNVRERGPDGRSRPKPIVLVHLGREDTVDRQRPEQAKDLLDQLIREKFGEEPEAHREAVEELRPALQGLKVLTSRAMGMRVVAEHVWQELGLRDALRRADADSQARIGLLPRPRSAA